MLKNTVGRRPCSTSVSHVAKIDYNLNARTHTNTNTAQNLLCAHEQQGASRNKPESKLVFNDPESGAVKKMKKTKFSDATLLVFKIRQILQSAKRNILMIEKHHI